MSIRKDRIIDNFHGTAVADPYRWLEDSEDSEVKEWIARQQGVRADFFAGEDPRPELEERLIDLWDYPRVSHPVQVGPWYFYQKNSGLQPQPVLYRQEGLSGEPEVVLIPICGAKTERSP